mgnify:CR=1 FL=1
MPLLECYGLVKDYPGKRAVAGVEAWPDRYAHELARGEGGSRVEDRGAPVARGAARETAPYPRQQVLTGEPRVRHRHRNGRGGGAIREVLGQRLSNVGIRLKGHRSMRDLDDKPAFVLDFRRFAPGRLAGHHHDPQ